MDARTIRPDPRLASPAEVPPTWDPERDDALVVRQVRQETADVKTFVLASATPARFRYLPGQFITLDLDIDGTRLNRCYTLSSSPTRPDTAAITVKRVPGGPVSNFLHDRLREGSVLRAVGPMGDFTCAQHEAPRYLFLSGGSGITPVMSMARAHWDLATGADIAFLHSARTPADIIFRAELELMARTTPTFRFAAICEADAPFEPWHGLRGRLSLAHLEAVVPDFRTREVFVCGPAPYMAAVRDMLRSAGFDMARHHEESFDFATLAAAEPEVGVEVIAAEGEAGATRMHRVEFRKSGRVIECPEDMNVLEAARRAGMRLPSSCTKGLCGTCKCKLTEGTVEMKHGGGIRQREIDAGMVLICCARPTSDLVIER
ncbi:ferredoxin-NADP reductase [Azorhizobium sp. AG788]|uniref:hybrid-cluster NAD(P)-dependent oxidoreductase n=1 Tax=Azorhizobium sp. AG788 TaxID=2183897 RepID=UPI00105C9D79|nr:hybrid-cluster NAD(P)-dependent oxidoreductase [Azorhizobium sp. AG788]TDT92616.1 ferredoxin-NADP reductase [Azorhizobium sp. AG788]